MAPDFTSEQAELTSTESDERGWICKWLCCGCHLDGLCSQLLRECPESYFTCGGSFLLCPCLLDYPDAGFQKEFETTILQCKSVALSWAEGLILFLLMCHFLQSHTGMKTSLWVLFLPDVHHLNTNPCSRHPTSSHHLTMTPRKSVLCSPPSKRDTFSSIKQLLTYQHTFKLTFTVALPFLH